MKRSGKDHGAALLEFAMALPFALILFIGIGDFSVYFWRQTQMEEAARLTVAKLAPSFPGYVAADADSLLRFSQALQEEVRNESGINRITVALSRQYACPQASGTEREPTAQPQLCSGERIYLRVASDDPVEPLLGPLRWMGFPKTAFSRHVIRIR
ncbi:MAG: TadE/TadG family type IV pilus assembly protein [Bryobacteraceae bacterium]